MFFKKRISKKRLTELLILTDNKRYTAEVKAILLQKQVTDLWNTIFQENEIIEIQAARIRELEEILDGIQSCLDYEKCKD